MCAAEGLLSCMDLHVCLEGSSCIAGEVTICARERLLSTMNQHVPFEINSTDAWVTTLVATVGLSIMLKHVCFEVFGHLEGEITLNT